MVLVGNGTISVPSTNVSLDMRAGTIIIANNTSNVSHNGHNAEWYMGSIVAHFPFGNGKVSHTLVNEGPCNSTDQSTQY